MIIKVNNSYLSWNRLERKWTLSKNTLDAFRFENEKQLEKIVKKINIKDYKIVG